jgi:hypothetical protein
MSTTYLDAVNDLLTETNEVQLTASNFSSAVGIHAFIKNAVNRSYLDICTYKKTWPFLSAASSNINDPFAGNITVDVTTGQRWYLLKSGATNVTNDFSKVDWDSFFITTEGVVGATEPYVYKNLKPVSFNDWMARGFVSEAVDAGSTQTYAVPDYVIASKDGRYFGLSSIPNDDMKVYFNAWIQPTRLSAYSDEILIPDKYINVLYDKARYYIHQFKENEMQASLSRQDYRDGIKKMSIDLIGEEPRDFRDDRTRPI